MHLKEKGKPLKKKQTKQNKQTKQTNKQTKLVRPSPVRPVSVRIADSCGQVSGQFADSEIAEHALWTVVSVPSVFAGDLIQTSRFASSILVSTLN